MSKLRFEVWAPAVVALAGLLIVAAWWRYNPGGDLKARVPGTDRLSDDPAVAASTARWEGKLVRSNGLPADLKGSWPQFRGPNRDNISSDSIPLLRAWGADGPRKLWQIEVGEGFAGAAIWRGRVYLMDYDRESQADALRCLSLADGREIWRYTYPAKIKRNHGMSRTIPAVTDRYVVSLGPKCEVLCLKTEAGELLWHQDLVRQFNAEVPPWYAGQCPLIEGERAILATGGDALLVAIECATGKVLWQSPNPRNWQMTHSSVTPFVFGGKRMYAYCGSGGVAGIAADSGALLWDTTDWKISIATVPSPVYLGDGKLFLSGGYNAGSLMLQLKQQTNGIAVETLFRLKANVFGTTQQTPAWYQNYLFGIRTPDGPLVCLDPKGKVVWDSGSERFGNGPYLIAQDLLLAMNDSGVLTLAEASTTGFKKLSQAKVLPGPDAWGPMALADGRLIVRDLTTMVCLDVAGK
jgi:outer membrane protein assembly factor BamB